MDIKDRIKSNQQKITGIQQRLNQVETEKQELLQEALRLDGELRLLKELEEKPNVRADNN